MSYFRAWLRPTLFFSSSLQKQYCLRDGCNQVCISFLLIKHSFSFIGDSESSSFMSSLLELSTVIDSSSKEQMNNIMDSFICILGALTVY